jgi:hypothetical protein
LARAIACTPGWASRLRFRFLPLSLSLEWGTASTVATAMARRAPSVEAGGGEGVLKDKPRSWLSIPIKP